MDSIENIVEKQRDYFFGGQTLPLSFRVDRLRALQSEIIKRQVDIEGALAADHKRHHFETFLTETLILLASLKDAVKNTVRRGTPRKIRSSLLNFRSSDRIVPEPYGLSLIISPWNYPFLLSLGPLTAAISAGNCAIMKPSEFSPTTSILLAEITRAVFPEEYVTVVQGDADTAGHLLKQKFDKIFFTGSARVGQIVLQAAAKNITPTTLELGGKNPCIVSETAELSLAARRIVWGKMLNAGQTCLAPDYLLVHESVTDELLERLAEAVVAFYGRDIRHNSDYARIINKINHSRLKSYLEPGKVAWGGENDSEELYFGPTFMTNVVWDDRVMAEEIFGPILPIMTYRSLDEVVNRINGRDKPLALYLFSQDLGQADLILSRCRFGGGCLNDTLSHFINARLPFGGTGRSGLGSYHGQWGFDAFTHYKGLLNRGLWPDVPLRYPPYAGKDKLKSLLTRFFGAI